MRRLRLVRVALQDLLVVLQGGDVVALGRRRARSLDARLRLRLGTEGLTGDLLSLLAGPRTRPLTAGGNATQRRRPPLITPMRMDRRPGRRRRGRTSDDDDSSCPTWPLPLLATTATAEGAGGASSARKATAARAT